MFPTLLKVPLQVFDIVQFSRSCSSWPLGRRLVYFITSGLVCQALFLHLFSSDFEVLSWFRAFAEVRSAGRLSIILQIPPFCQPLFFIFFDFDFPLTVWTEKEPPIHSYRRLSFKKTNQRISIFSLYFRLPRIFLTGVLHLLGLHFLGGIGQNQGECHALFCLRPHSCRGRHRTE